MNKCGPENSAFTATELDDIIYQKSTFQLRQTGSAKVQPPTAKAYPAGKVPIKKAKLDDVKKLISYIPDEVSLKDGSIVKPHVFYKNLLKWPTTGSADDDNDSDSDADVEE